MSSENTEIFSLKPNKWSFLLLRQWIWLLLVIILLCLIWVLIVPSDILIPIYFFLILMIIIWLIRLITSIIEYKKENYTFNLDNINHNHWTIFTWWTVDIQINKITQVYSRLGFIENLLFKTGSITIKTAWSWSWKIYLKSVNNPMKIYEHIQKMMQQNGFKLKKENLVQEAKPHFLWIFW